MKTLEVGDWFNFTEESRPDLIEDGPYKVEYISEKHIGYISASGGMTFARHDEVEPHMPRLKESMGQPDRFEIPVKVKDVLDRADQIVDPNYEWAWDGQVLHREEVAMLRLAVSVMIEYPEYRDEILKRVAKVTDMGILHW